MRVSKKRKAALAMVDAKREYSLVEAVELVKKMTYTKFDASVDIDMRLGVDPRKANEAIRGVVSLPHGTGKSVRVLALCSPDKEQEAKDAGADYAGLDEFLEKIKTGWLEFDVVIAMPQLMGKIGQVARVLGPRGLMPNPKSGTVTQEVGKAVSEVKKGKIDFRVDKFGVMHVSLGRVSFSVEQLVENAKEFIATVNRLKPNSLKGTYVKSVYLSSTMSPGVNVDIHDATL
ncbi:MAG: 50S ribosomal protein L1 [Bacteroides sp.]|jgi:ribosomal protein L1